MKTCFRKTFSDASKTFVQLKLMFGCLLGIKEKLLSKLESHVVLYLKKPFIETASLHAAIFHQLLALN